MVIRMYVVAIHAKNKSVERIKKSMSCVFFDSVF